MTARQRPRQGSPLHLKGAFELFAPSKELVLKNIWIFGPLYAVPLLFWMQAWMSNVSTVHGPSQWRYRFENHGLGWNGPSLPSYTWGYFIGAGIILALVVIVAGLFIQVMTQEAQLEASENKNLDFGRLLNVARQVWLKMLGLYILVGLITVIGFILLIVPGIIMLRRYLLAPYVLLDNPKLSIWEAMERSATMTKTHSGSVYGVLGVMLLIGLVGVVPLIGWLVSFLLSLFYSVAAALRYQELKKISVGGI